MDYRIPLLRRLRHLTPRPSRIWKHAHSPVGRLPDLLIAGTVKGGTTSLHFYLSQHPLVHSGLRKEVHYFDKSYHRGERWYRKHFTRQPGGIVLDSTPNYIYFEGACERILKLMPTVKIVLLLRDPVYRAFSHFQHSCRRKFEGRSFDDAVRQDMHDFKKLGAFGDDSLENGFHSYVRRGVYAPQVKRLQAAFGDQLLVFRSKDFFQSPLAITNQVLRHCGLTELPTLEFEQFNKGDYKQTMSPEIKQELEQFFAPHNAELCEALNVPNWWPYASQAPTAIHRAA
ncbi:sulfotransferase family protein [Planctomicrobium piriforme]|uniref:Sulfotransferase domain-containing protein n=1 Tax=Planctomicrobium piriforme TaxID=1576369 RepID=A0A1I3DLL8_9PLAN|nr:sulfotransferase [Planctomicrobium piriforme]SFH87596.1 Sulfotransferase domain-containing protein [Planctomicrobium piriforme]